MNDVVLIRSDRLGSGDDRLGSILMGNFLRILGDREDLPKYIVLLNSGVRLAVDDSDSLSFLKRLEERGVSIINCITCVEFFGMEDRISVGVVDGMMRIIDVLSSHNVITV